MADGSQRPTRRFSAFISYSSADAAFARRLHRRLETYRLPRRLGRGDLAGASKRLKPLFRDIDELTATHDLSAAVREALAESDFLIVICSPRAAGSEWVAREIEYFRSVHGDGRILAALIEGDPATAFPPALLRTAAGEPVEPLAADFRKDSGFRRLAMLKLVATLAGVELDQLVQRDAQRVVRRMVAATSAAFGVLAVVVALTWMMLDARAEALRRREQASGLVDFMVSDVRKDLQRSGRLDQLAKLNARALSYFAGQDPRELSVEERIGRAKTLQAMGEDEEKRGEYARARALFEEAYRITAGVLAAKPNDPDRIFAHAQSEYWMGFIDWRNGLPSEARKGFEAYAFQARRLMVAEPSSVRGLMELGYAETNLGMLAMRQRGDMRAAQRHFAKSISIKRSLADRRPGNEELLRDLANAYAWLADAQRLAGDYSSATETRTNQRSILRQLLAADPENLQVSTDLLGNELALARIEADQGRYRSAIKRVDIARQRATALTRLDPDNKSIKRQARAFDVFKAKFILDSPADPSGRAHAARKELGRCDAGDAGDHELALLCAILLDRARGIQRDYAISDHAFGQDLYTPRWGIDLPEEQRLAKITGETR